MTLNRKIDDPKFGLLLMVIFAILMFLLSSCRTIEYVEVPKEVIKTEYRDKVVTDTIIEKDSVSVLIKGDTIWRDRIKYKYVYKERVDTVIVTDYETKTKIITKERQLTKWESIKMTLGGWCMTALIMLLIGIVGYIAFKIWKR